MGNVTINLPNGKSFDIEEGLLADPEVKNHIAKMYDDAEPISFGQNVVEKGKAALGGVMQNLSAIPKYVALKAKQLDQDLPNSWQSYKGKDVKDLVSYKFGEALQKAVPEVDPRVKDTMATQVAQGLGQVAGSIGLGLATGGTSLPGQIVASAVPAVAMQSAEDYEKAKKKGATEQQAQTAGNWGGVWGVTDVLPFENAFKILKGASPGLKGLTKEAFQQFVLEGGQEGLQQVMSNATAKLTYDEQQKLMEDVLPSATVGGVVGAIAGTILHGLGAKGKIKIEPTNVAGPAEGSAAEAILALRTKGVGEVAPDLTTIAEAESAPLEPTTIDTIQANEEGQLTPKQKFAKQLLGLGANEAEVHDNLSIWNTVALSRGMDLDTFLERNNLDIQRGGDTSGQTEGQTDAEEGHANEGRKETLLRQTGAAGEVAPFYSKLESVIQEKMPGRMKNKDFLNFLEKNGVTKDELTLFGKEEFEGIDNLWWTKKQVLEEIKASSVQLEDVVLGSPKTDADIKRIDYLTSLPRRTPAESAEAQQLMSVSDNPQFSSYQLPGGKEGSYREMFVTAPSHGKQFIKQTPAELAEEYTNGFITQEEYNQRKRDGGFFPTVGDQWKDGHTQYSNIQNPIVRIRFNERETDGKRLLFVEEMQGPSDAEQGKMPAYLRKRIYDIGTKRILSYAKANGFDGVAWTTGDQQAERYNLQNYINKVVATPNNKEGLWKGKTNNNKYWLYSPEETARVWKTFPEGHASVEIQSPDGEEIIDVLDFKTLNEAQDYLNQHAEFPGDMYLLDVTSKEGESVFSGHLRPRELENYVGKELAQKIVNNNGGIFEGLDLKVGGEGLKSLYDKMLPSLMKKYGKESVESVKHESIGDVSYIPITDKTPSSQPLFQDARSKIERSGLAAKGSVQFLEDGRTIISLFEGSDVSTIFHESAHIFRRWLTPEEAQVANEWVGATNEDWTVEQEEMWARGFERYLRRGKSPNEYLRAVFERAKNWLRQIYKVVKGSAIDVHLDPKIVSLFDKILTPTELPTQKAAWEMPFEAWKKVHGEDEAAMYGLTNKSVSLRKSSRFNTLVNALSNKGTRGVLFGRYMTPLETDQQLALVSQPEYLQTPIADGNMDEYIIRVLNLFAVRANASFHTGEAVSPILEDLRKQQASAEQKGLFDNDPGHGYQDEFFTGFITRKSAFADTIDFVSKLSEVQKVKESWTTPVREQLQNIKTNRYKDQNDVIMDRVTGRIYAVEQKGLHSASMVDVDRGDVRRVPIANLYSDFIWPDIITDDSKATLTKEEWMAEKHYQEVVEALDKGETVPSFVIAEHLTKDPSLQEAFDLAKKREEAVSGDTTTYQSIAELFQDREFIGPIEQSQESVKVGAHPEYQVQVEQIGRAIEESYVALTKLANVLDKDDSIRLTDLIKKTELQKLARKSGQVSDLSSEHYVAEIFNELDEYKEGLEKQTDTLNPGTIATMMDRVGYIHAMLSNFVESIENNGQGRLLEEGSTTNTIRQASHWLQRNIFKIEPSKESQIGNWAEEVFFAMQQFSWRHPIVRPLFKLEIARKNKAAILAHDLIMGNSTIDVVSFETAKGAVEIKLKSPGLRTLGSMQTNSKSYDTLKAGILLGDHLQMQFTLEDILLGFGEKIDALVAQASQIEPTSAANISKIKEITEKAASLQYFDEILNRRSVEERKQIAQAYFEIQDTNMNIYFKKKKMLTDTLGESAGEEILKVLYPKGYIPGHFPHMRFGSYGVVVKDAATNKTKYYTAYEDKWSQKTALEQLRQKYPGDHVSTVNTQERLEYKFDGGKLVTQLQDVINRTQLDSVIQDKEALDHVKKMLFSTVSEMVNTSGIFSSFKKRNNILGFDERISMVMHKQVHDFANAMAKIEFAKKGAVEVAGLINNKHIYNYANNWFGAMLEGGDSIDTWLNRFRAAVYLKYLGFNIKTALVMHMDKLTNAPVVLGRFTSNPITKLAKDYPDTVKFITWLHGVEKVMNAEGLSRDDAIRKVGMPERMEPELVNALLWSKDSGATLAKFTPEIFNQEDMTWEEGLTGQSAMGKAWDVTKFGLSKVMEHASWMGARMEELGKISTFMTAFKVLRKEKGWSYDRALDVAQDIVNDTHIVYGKANLPKPLLGKSGLHKAARTAYIFGQFGHSYMQMLTNLGTIEGARGKKAVVTSLGILAALGGVPAIPFMSSIFKAWGLSTGDDPEQWFRKMLTRATGTDWAAKVFSDGLPGLAGVSIRGSLSIGGSGTWQDMLVGVAGSTYKDVGKIVSAAGNKDWDTVLKTGMPTAASSVYKAYQGATTGVVTSKGNPLREGMIEEPIKYTGYETLMKAASFPIERELAAMRLRQAGENEDEYWAGKRSKIYEKFAKGARMEDKAYMQSALEDAIAYERERVSRRAVDIPPLSRGSLKRSLEESGLHKKAVLKVLRLTGRLP